MQFLGSDATAVISAKKKGKGFQQAVWSGIDTTGGWNVHRRWHGFSEFSDCSNFADFSADVPMSQ